MNRMGERFFGGWRGCVFGREREMTINWNLSGWIQEYSSPGGIAFVRRGDNWENIQEVQ